MDPSHSGILGWAVGDHSHASSISPPLRPQSHGWSNKTLPVRVLSTSHMFCLRTIQILVTIIGLRWSFRGFGLGLIIIFAERAQDLTEGEPLAYFSIAGGLQ